MLKRLDLGAMEEEGQAQKLVHFDGFPYLVTYVVPALYHIILLPADLGQSELIEIALRQVMANRLKTCLVLGEGRCVYYDEDGSAVAHTMIPESSHFCSGKLYACAEFGETEEMTVRREALRAFEDSLRGDGYLFGDPTNGGRPAKGEELIRLSGQQAGGIPNGLERCDTCGEWRGACLDPNPHYWGLVMPVYCRCENDNRCARCGGLLYERKLNANFFEPTDGRIWHVPGFIGFNHRCPDVN